MRSKTILALTVLIAAMLSASAEATTYSEDFTGSGNNNSWYFFNGACLTAGTSSTVNTSPGNVTSCKSIISSYYNVQSDHDPALVGGVKGYLGSLTVPSTPSQMVPDPLGQGALRFTNGYSYGHNENGAIVSGTSFDASQGVQISFKTVTYLGDSGGSGGDGADGMSFFLMDANYAAGIGAWGGSLGYTCSNANPPYNGLAGAYLGLGIDEYGNFLNQSDNTASGYGYQPGRIGLRGAGSVSWAALTAAYGSNPSSSTKPYYPASLATSCNNGTYDSNLKTCPVCSSGTYDQSTGQCMSCSTGTYVMGSGTTCTGGTPSVCTSGYTLYGGSCDSCATGYTFQSTGTHAGYCKSGSTYKNTTPTLITTLPTDPSATGASPGSYGTLYSLLATQNTCQHGTLYNYLTPSSPTGAGATSLTNTVNTGKILDYGVIPNAYQVLSGFKIAKESAITRSQADVLYYNLQITQSGLLSLSYSLNGAAYQQVIKNQDITASNGPLPTSLLFGFAGSSGGSTNIHEIMCFKAAPTDQSGSSVAVNEKQSAKVQTGTQAYFAFYNGGNWTGSITANSLINNSDGSVSVASTANWDASCNLTGVSTGNTCASTGAGSSSAQAPTSRVMMTWNGTQGIPFEWSSLGSTLQGVLNTGDSNGSARLQFLRGDRSNELTKTGSGLFRIRDGVLGDIVDASPVWVGPPQNTQYNGAWSDFLYPAAVAAENSGQTYQAFASADQTRLNVVYGGANDGFLHGFRSGSFDNNGNFVNNSSTPNDGKEVLAYMPGAVLQSPASSTTSLNCANPGNTTQTVGQNIHGVTPAIGASSACVNPSLDYSNAQYGHNFFVDAPPASSDLFYNGTWHTWLVGGLGSGGAAIYALDVTNPAGFTEGNANTIAIGEWNSANITCQYVANCGNNLGNTYGSPVIRRLHNGQWAMIFGNGFGSSSGDAGIYVMTIDPSNGNKSFYYLSTGSSGNNGIAYVAPVDLDGDQITDYVYAGDLRGHAWRFDLTSNNPSTWSSATPSLLFTTPSGQPITSKFIYSINNVDISGMPRLLVEFGTGQRTQLTNTTATSYVSGTQALYGIWDWNMNAWNTLAPQNQFASLSGPQSFSISNLEQQVFTITSNNDRDGTNNPVCWKGTTACSTLNNQFGWYANLPGTSEQIVYNPVFVSGAFVVNSVVPATNTPTSCTLNSDTGITYIINSTTGGVYNQLFSNNSDVNVAGASTNASGSVFVVINSLTNSLNLIYQTINANTSTGGSSGGSSSSSSSSSGPGSDCLTQDCKPNISSTMSVKRLGWRQIR